MSTRPCAASSPRSARAATPPSSTIPPASTASPLTPAKLRVSEAEFAGGGSRGRGQDARRAGRLPATASAAHHERRSRSDDRYVDAIGVELGSRWTAIEAVGLYVPGGTASYPSSVLMNAVPAKVAGVDARGDGRADARRRRSIRWCWWRRRLAGVDELYRIGGAQAVGGARLWHRDASARSAKIVGPGNAYVAAAKRRVFGTVGIDMIAGPSEVLVIADRDNDPDWIAADLLAQAEHDPAAQSILITDDAGARRRASRRRSSAQLATLPRGEIGGGELARLRRRHRRRATLGDAMPLANRMAPEHLEIAVADPSALVAGHPQCRRHLPRPHDARRRSATMSAAPTMCCRQRARPASRPASRCSTS